MNLVLDTCALLWLTLDPSELSARAHKRIAAAEELLVSSISLWEVGIKVKRKKLNLGVEYREYVERVSNARDLTIVPVDHIIWMESILLDWNHRDPADRVIVSLAQIKNAELISNDQIIKNFYSRTIG